MLNELLLIERGLTQNGFQLSETHADIKDVGQDAPLRVRLAADGAIDRIEPTEKGRAQLWTLRDGQHNSFPYTKLGQPLLSLPEDERSGEAEAWKKLKTAEARRAELVSLIAAHPVGETWRAWPGAGLRKRLRERLDQLASLADSDSAAVPATFERLLAALARETPIIAELAARLTQALDEEGEVWIAVARKILVEGGTLYFDVDDRDFDRDAGDHRNKGPVSLALSGDGTGGVAGPCSLTGVTTRLHEGNFPQPNLPSLGQTYLFAKNKEIPAAHRYGRFAAGAFPIGSELLKRLGGGLSEITDGRRKGVTWQLVPSEKPKQGDLLLAFLPGDLSLPVADVVAPRSTEAADLALEELNKRRIAYEEKGGRALADLDGRVRQARPENAVQLCIIRKLDPANRKAIFSRVVTVASLHEAAMRWRDGCANHPPIAMRVPGQKGERAKLAEPPMIAPADVPAMTRRLFVDGGRRVSELAGVTATEAFALFLEEGDVRQRARAVLSAVVQRHGPLLTGAAHALRRGLEEAKDFKRDDALRSVTLLGILLHKGDRPKESYMADAAFKLGQLLAVADVVHVGYCADLRGGDVPPVLLGNSVLSMAQSNPNKGLAVLCGRWKPYGAWAGRADVARERAAGLRREAQRLASQGRKEDEKRLWQLRNRASAIYDALEEAIRVKPMCNDLKRTLQNAPAGTDTFKAELLLGYIAGLPRKDEQAEKSASQGAPSNG